MLLFVFNYFLFFCIGLKCHYNCFVLYIYIILHIHMCVHMSSYMLKHVSNTHNFELFINKTDAEQFCNILSKKASIFLKYITVLHSVLLKHLLSFKEKFKILSSSKLA